MFSADANWDNILNEDDLKVLGYSEEELEQSYIHVPNMLKGLINAISSKGLRFNPETEELITA